ncbi:MAG: TraR/DksA family transcriptional regulator [Actinomycetota bacterium]
MDSTQARLTTHKAELTAELERMAAPPEEISNISFGKRVGEGTSMAVDRLVQVEAYDQLQALLADVTRALEKIDESNYGTCDRCGAQIPSERLEILPWAVLCVRCAEKR